MEQIGWQIIVRCRDDRVLAPPGEARLLYLDAVLTHGEKHGLYSHGLGDTHGHLTTIGTRKQAGELARRLVLTLARTLPGKPDFEPSRIVAIHDQRHLGSLVGYCLGQDAHHGVGLDPLREATAAFDYLGLRPRGAFLLDRLRTHLPRISDRDILKHLPHRPVECFDLAHLYDATVAAIATSNATLLRTALIAAVHSAHPPAGGESGDTRKFAAGNSAAGNCADPLPPSARLIATALRLNVRTVERLRHAAPEPQLVHAIRLQMGLRSADAHLRRPQPTIQAEQPANYVDGFDSVEDSLAAEFAAAAR